MITSPPAHPTTWPETMALVLPIIWNSEADWVRFRAMSCRDAGRQYGMRAFVCRTEQLVLRSGHVRHYKFTVLCDGTVTTVSKE